MTNLNIAKLYLATNTTATAAEIDAAIADGSAATAVTALTGTALLNAIYQASFGRDADAEGIAYWTSVSLTGDALVTAINGGAALYPADGALAATAASDTTIVAAKTTAEAAAGTTAIGAAAVSLVSVVDTATAATAVTAIDAAEAVVASDAGTASAGLGEYASIADGGLFTGTDLDDTFLATAGQTENAIIQGGAGRDTLKASLDATDDNVAPSTTSVEVFMLRDTNGDTIDLVDAVGLEQVYSDRSSADLTLDNVSTDIQVGMKSTDTTTTVTYDAVTGDADEVTLRLDSTEAGASFIAAGIETVRVLLEDDSDIDLATTADYTALEVVGTGDLELNTLDTTTLTVDASQMTGALTAITASTIDTTVTSGAGDDEITANGTADLTISTGNGDDTIDMIATLTVDDTIDAGAGNDTLAITNATGAALVTGLSVSNVETIEVTTTDGGSATSTIDADFTDATAITFISNDDVDDAVTFTDTAGETLTVTNLDGALQAGFTTVTVGLKVNTGTTLLGTAESVTLNIANADETDIMKIDAALAIDEVENVTLNLTANDEIEALATNVTEIAVDAITVNEIEVLTITGDAQDVTLGGDTALTMETITAAASTSNITVDLGVADQTVTLGAGDDTINTTANGNADDTIDGGAGDDTMTVTVATGVSAVSAVTTNVETVTVAMAITGVDTTDVTNTFDASNLSTDTTSIVLTSTYTADGTVVAAADQNIHAITGLQVGTIVTASGDFSDGANDLNVVSVALETATGSSDSITVSLDSNTDNDDTTADAVTQDIDVISIADIETVTLTVAEDGIETITTTIGSLSLDNTDTTSLVLSAPATTLTSLEVTAMTNDAVLTSIDASGITGALTLGELSVAGLTLTLGNATAITNAIDITLDSTEAENDTIVFGATMVGDVTVTNFTEGQGITADKLDLSEYGITSIDDLSFTDGGTNVVIDTVATDASFGQIDLAGVANISDLAETNFIFA